MKKIRYEFITEEIVEIEISDEWGEKLKSVKREQLEAGQTGGASQRKLRRSGWQGRILCRFRWWSLCNDRRRKVQRLQSGPWKTNRKSLFRTQRKPAGAAENSLWGWNVEAGICRCNRRVSFSNITPAWNHQKKIKKNFEMSLKFFAFLSIGWEAKSGRTFVKKSWQPVTSRDNKLHFENGIHSHQVLSLWYIG